MIRAVNPNQDRWCLISVIHDEAKWGSLRWWRRRNGRWEGNQVHVIVIDGRDVGLLIESSRYGECEIFVGMLRGEQDHLLPVIRNRISNNENRNEYVTAIVQKHEADIWTTAGFRRVGRSSQRVYWHRDMEPE